jgi:acetolactate synthase-1/2/3 large subunit
VTSVQRASDLPDVIAHAFTVAASGRPGPVVVALPEDVQAEHADVADARPYEPASPTASGAEVQRALELLAGAERPLVIAGGGGWSAATAADLRAFAEASNIPVAASFRRQDYVDNRSAVYAGHLTLSLDPALAQRVQDADVVLALGTRLGEITTAGYTLLEAPQPRQKLIHVHAELDELGRVYQPLLAIASSSASFCAALTPIDGTRWSEWTRTAREDYLANLEHGSMPGALDLGASVAHLRRTLPEDAIITNGAGNFSVWAHRFYEFRRHGTQLAPTSGSMGYGVPAAIAAKIAHPDRTVVCLAGDGDFLMSGHELATAIRHDAAVVVLVVNNGMYGTIRMHQERQFPGRVASTDLVNPDFAAYARAFGAHGSIVERTDEFPAAFAAALESGRPAVLELRIDPEAITPRTTLSAIRAASSGGDPRAGARPRGTRRPGAAARRRRGPARRR